MRFEQQPLDQGPTGATACSELKRFVLDFQCDARLTNACEQPERPIDMAEMEQLVTMCNSLKEALDSISDADVAETVREATRLVHAAAQRADRRVAILPGSPDDAELQAKAGSTAFILSSDQGFLRSAAMQAHARMSEAVTRATKEVTHV